jgi:spore coat polysaccharide biosynthesis predicted glycosyltransferase SpsG
MLLKDLIACLFEGHGIPKKVFFRVDAGRIEGMSFGHLARCHILSKALKDYWNVETSFVMRNYTEGINNALALDEKVLSIDARNSDWMRSVTDTIIFDLPTGPLQNELNIAKEKSIWTVILDDLNNKISRANVVLNSSVLADVSVYPGNARLLMGPEYLILNEQFQEASCKGRKQNNELSVLITLGGSDLTGLTLNVLKALTKNDYCGFVFNVILGPGFKDNGDIDKVAGCFPDKINVFRNPPDLLPFFVECNLAICAGGRTLYELNALKVPTIAISSIEHEMITIKAFKEKGMILGGLNKWDECDFLKLFEYAEVQVKSCYLRYAGD